MGDFQLSLKLINTHQKLICWCSFKNWKIYETCVCVCVCFFLINLISHEILHQGLIWLFFFESSEIIKLASLITLVWVLFVDFFLNNYFWMHKKFLLVDSKFKASRIYLIPRGNTLLWLSKIHFFKNGVYILVFKYKIIISFIIRLC